MFYTFTLNREYESEGQLQKEYSVETFEDAEKTKSLGHSSYHVLSSNQNFEQEFIDAANAPPITARPATYVDKRRDAYPPITDYLDGVVKGDQAQIDAYIAACQAVKAMFQKN